MDDQEIAAQIQRRGLEIVYLSELAAQLGFTFDEGWSDAVMAAIENASAQERRTAALRTIELADRRTP